jgi:hypothetical protein
MDHLSSRECNVAETAQLRDAKGPLAIGARDHSSRSGLLRDGKGPIMTVMTPILFASTANVKFFLRITWNLHSPKGVASDSST